MLDKEIQQQLPANHASFIYEYLPCAYIHHTLLTHGHLTSTRDACRRPEALGVAGMETQKGLKKWIL